MSAELRDYSQWVVNEVSWEPGYIHVELVQAKPVDLLTLRGEAARVDVLMPSDLMAQLVAEWRRMHPEGV